MRPAFMWFMGVLLVLPGCGTSGPKLQPVRGELFVNKQPAKGALVVFHPVNDNRVSAIRPSAEVQEDGSFSLTSIKPRDGAPEGDYVVTVSWPVQKATSMAAIKGMGGEGESKGATTDRLGDRYRNAGSSTIRRKITLGTGQIERIDIQQ